MQNLININCVEITVDDVRAIVCRSNIQFTRLLYIVATINNKFDDLDPHWRESITLLEIHSINNILFTDTRCVISDELAALFCDMYKLALVGSYSIKGVSESLINEVKSLSIDLIIDNDTLVW